MFFQWVDIPLSIVKNFYFDNLYHYEQSMKKTDNESSRCSIEFDLLIKSTSVPLQEELRKNVIQIDKDIERTQSEC